MKGTPTSKQQADLQDKRTTLIRRIQRWREVQLTYIPCVGPILAAALCVTTETDTPFIELAEHTSLHLPSSLPQHLRESPSISHVVEKEKRLRIAQADDALADIRRQRRIITGLWQFKKLNVAGTGNKPNTRMRSLYNRFNNKMQRSAERYRAAHTALLSLEPHGTWRERLKFLRSSDIRGPGKDDDGTSNGRFEPSWIWLVPRVNSAPDMEDSEAHLDDSMRPEWAKSQARMKRWEEEVLIVEEEMRRVIVYLEWKAGWWREQGILRGKANAGDFDILDGVEAYAQKQASILERLAAKCAGYWLPTLLKHGFKPEWAGRYALPASSGELADTRSGENVTPTSAGALALADDDDDDDDDGEDESDSEVDYGVDTYEIED